MPKIASGSLWEPLAASGSLWELLGASGSLWEPLGASGSLWEPLGASVSNLFLQPWGRPWGGLGTALGSSLKGLGCLLEPSCCLPGRPSKTSFLEGRTFQLAEAG